MLSEILSALQILLEAISAYQGPDKRRRRIGRRLATICQDIDELVENGREILLSFDTGKPILLVTLKMQQRALKKLIKALKHPHVERVLAIHLPNFKRIEILFEPKSQLIGLLVKHWVHGQRLTQFDLKESEQREPNNDHLSSLLGLGTDHRNIALRGGGVARVAPPVEHVDIKAKLPSSWPFAVLRWFGYPGMFSTYLRYWSGNVEVTLMGTRRHMREAGETLT